MGKEGPAPGKGRPSELVGKQEELLSTPKRCPKALPETPGVSRAGMICSLPQIASDHRKKSLVDHKGGGAGGTKRSIPFLASHRTRKKYPLQRPAGAGHQKFANLRSPSPLQSHAGWSVADSLRDPGGGACAAG